MPNAIVQGFQSVAKFEGRDRRARFWPYVAVVVGLHFVIQMLGVAVIAVPLMAELQTSIENEIEPKLDRLEAAGTFMLVFMAALGVSYLALFGRSGDAEGSMTPGVGRSGVCCLFPSSPTTPSCSGSLGLTGSGQMSGFSCP